mmetsp:Transcript_39834/g.63743  ORF Transcript_39834/g.63743 Transcript_39834/m.63743 type:complete len:126 (+) Transcript_39834:666-1043(+)
MFTNYFYFYRYIIPFVVIGPSFLVHVYMYFCVLLDNIVSVHALSRCNLFFLLHDMFLSIYLFMNFSQFACPKCCISTYCNVSSLIGYIVLASVFFSSLIIIILFCFCFCFCFVLFCGGECVLAIE